VSLSAKGAAAVIEVKVKFAVPVLVTVTVCAALLLPTAMLPKLRLVAESETADAPTPVPDSAATCVLAVPLLLSVTVNAPYKLPAVVGAKFTAIVQLPPAATGTAVEQLVPAAAIPNGPVVAIPLIVKLAVPVLFSVTVCDALVVPTACEVAKGTLAGVSVAIGAVTPAPMSTIVCGLLGALSAKVTEPTTLAAVVGVKVMLMRQIPWAAIGEVHVLVVVKPLLGVMEVKLSGAVPVLVTVTVCAALDVPRATLPKFTLLEESSTPGRFTPVPVSRIICGLLGALSVRVSDPMLGPATTGVKVRRMVQLVVG